MIDKRTWQSTERVAAGKAPAGVLFPRPGDCVSREQENFEMKSVFTLGIVLAVALQVQILFAAEGPGSPAIASQRAEAIRHQADGNFQDAYRIFRQLLLEGTPGSSIEAADLTRAWQCLRRLGRVNQVDSFVEDVLEKHGDHWRILEAAANIYVQQEHHGFLVAGKFERGHRRGGGRFVHATQRDRTRALQLFQQALPLVLSDDDKAAVSNFLLQLARAITAGELQHAAWRLQTLTDLNGELPDYEEGHGRYDGTTGAPVDQQNRPVFHHTVASWQEASSDGQRWRWALDQVVENSPGRRNEVLLLLANFHHRQFGVQTMRSAGYFRGAGFADDQQQKGTYALHTLKESETLARLATGIQRFELPDEFNFIKIYQRIVREPKSGHTRQALQQLARIFEDRRQYPRAAEYWRRIVRSAGARKSDRDHLQQIVGNWGRFESVLTQPAEEGASIEFTYRNGKRVHFTAQRLLVETLLNDVKTYLKSKPGRVDWKKININDVGHQIVRQNQSKYVGRQVASWDLELQPRPNHFDHRITVHTPLQKSGAYLLTGRMKNGNVSQVVIWVADTAIVKKQLSGKSFYFVADAVTGKPVQRANLEFFGYRQKPISEKRHRVETTNFAERTDVDGQVVPHPRDLRPDMQWVVTARSRGGRFAYLGFHSVWNGRYHDEQYNATKVFSLTDRPVYRPDQLVHFKCWVRNAKYDLPNTSNFAGRDFEVEIRDPRGNKVMGESFTADAYGGLEGQYQLPPDTTLGVYSLLVLRNKKRLGNGSFRVEEYKKPEFEVTVAAPSEPVVLGDKIQARIEAKYYFGSPVVQARVKYKVLRSQSTRAWYPEGKWDWCYDPGYWWFAYDYSWYPGWQRWAGCSRPSPWWWRPPAPPPEVVAQREVEIGPDGSLTIEIDTALAKALHGDQDHRYTITAEVVDSSRRTVVGSGQILATRQPFRVFTWVDRGHYRVGDVIQANFLAQTPNQRPVSGSGRVTLLKIHYDGQQNPVETVVRSWSLDADVTGRAQLQIDASAAGQYRLSYELTDADEHTMEGAYLFTVMGEGFDGRDYRFNQLELIPDQREYAPGDTVKLQINTDRIGSTVLVFVRPANGVYLPPRMVRLSGKSTIEEIAVVQRDMPNFFVEAITVSDGKVYTETKEIVVPPEKQIVNVELTPSKTEFLPGAEALVRLRLTNADGQPVVGSTALTIYDKSVDYVAGGSNVADIREVFWKWRRRHQSQSATNLARRFSNIPLFGEPVMRPVGAFGHTVADEMAQGGGRGMAFANGAELKRARSSGVAAPALMAAEAASDSELAMADASQAAPLEGGTAAPLIQPTLRSNFADTALWIGSVETDESGVAEISLKMPENLTTWRGRVWTVSHGTKVGTGEIQVVTRKNLIVRLQAPRFFVETDEVILSANVHNYLDSDKAVQVSLELPGNELGTSETLTRTVNVAATGEKRVDWRVRVLREGLAKIRLRALTDEESDALEMQFPVYVHGMLKTDSWASTVRPGVDSSRFVVNVPTRRRPEQSLLEVRYSPTLAGAMVDALPYLVSYPYGCTEQTLNRFLPTILTQKILLEMNIDLDSVREKRTNLNAQEIGNHAERAKQWNRRDTNPVFDESEVVRMVKEGVRRLTDMQNADGGWGWFAGSQERSWPHTTAVVVHGLQTAMDNDVPLVPGLLERGVDWLKRYQAEQVGRLQNWKHEKKPRKQFADNLDALIYMVLVQQDQPNSQMRDFLYRDRQRLAVYSKCMFGLALEHQGESKKLAMILRNIDQYLVQDEENETAYLKLPATNHWWYWYGSEVEANAYYLKLLSRVDPRGAKAPRLVKYLLNNRKNATSWNSTRDTSVCVEAFADFLRASDELLSEMTVEIWVDQRLRKAVEITPDNLFSFDNRFVLSGEALKAGSHEIEIRRQGKGAVYFNAYLTNFSLEDYIRRAGLEVKVDRKYYRLKEIDKKVDVAGSSGQVLQQRVEKFERVELRDLATLNSGDLVEVELEISSKNDYEYLIFEDMKPAGFEPVQLRSGYTDNGLGAYMELRDNRVAFFVRQLARGRHSVAYRMRAETPGRFSALPARGYAMYAPELRGNSDEIKLRVEDRSP
ncbi:MAG: alpha-2-macroglobulin [Planctomycetaceae bacterium]|nr:alpha-2-macroglobulin [Planctomycetaceae bacterium]MBP61468.1 alpha-2-macroglobulin [Planctomycetaceae bacterium]